MFFTKITTLFSPKCIPCQNIRPNVWKSSFAQLSTLEFARMSPSHRKTIKIIPENAITAIRKE